MKRLLLSILGLGLWGSLSAQAAVVSPVFSYGGHHYQIISPNTWQQANLEAIALGGHLAYVETSGENDFIVNTFANYQGSDHELWLGGLKVGGVFKWLNGAALTFSDFLPYEPNSDGGFEPYLAIWNHWGSSRFGWNDAGYTWNTPYGVVEYDSIPNL